jgi:GDP-D-mannose 3', 5'-epimerase
VTGGTGFIGSHLVDDLKRGGCWVRAVDLEPQRFGRSAADEVSVADLRDPTECERAMRGIDDVYALAADMGGMGYLDGRSAQVLSNNALIDVNVIGAARRAGVGRYFYASSACIYPEERQSSPGAAGLREEEAYPAMPQDGYGWEKLLGERLCGYYRDELGLDVRIARFHNVYGPRCAYDGGREKAPAALCRKVIEAPPGGVIDVWGDGSQRRSFCYVGDCVSGIRRLMASDFDHPLNIGTEQSVSIDELAETIIRIGGRTDLAIRHVPGPEGVRGRNSDNDRMREVLRWEPAVTLDAGLRETYAWISGAIGRPEPNTAAIR